MRCKVNKNGAFERGMAHLIPYVHHKNKMLWLVQVVEEDNVYDFHAIADDAIEAVKNAYSSYRKYLKEEMNLAKLMEEQKAEKEKKKRNISVKRRDVTHK